MHLVESLVQVAKMNSLLLLALLATAAAATVNSQVPELAKKSELAEIPEATEVAGNGEIEYSIDGYDEDGVPKRTIAATRQSLTIGTVGPDDRLVSRITYSVAPAMYIIPDQDVTYNGAHYTNITSVQVARVATTTNAVPTIKSGGLGKSFVVVNFLGVRGSGLSYTISIYASIGCANS